MYLLDINVLIALADPNHAHHRRAKEWFTSSDREAWATCPITENGFVRILGQPAYPDYDGDAADARIILQNLTSLPGHQFWPDDLSLCDAKTFPEMTTSKHLTDLYLLAMAIAHQGQLATLDRRISPEQLPEGGRAYFLIS